MIEWNKEVTDENIEQIKDVESIFEDPESISKDMASLKKFKKNNEKKLSYFREIIEYGLVIRPKHTEIYLNLLKKLNFNKKYSKHKNVFLTPEYEEAIMKDDIKAFNEIINSTAFNPWINVYVHRSDPIFFVNNDQKVSYLQHIAFYGAFNCFKQIIYDERFDSLNLCKYAVAGGNYGIIKILKEKGESFDHCYETALKFHRNDLWEKELFRYKKDDVKLPKTQQYYNDKAFFNILNETKGNSNIIRKCLITNSKIEALKTGNLGVIKYLEVDKEDKFYGESPLHISIKYHHIDIMKYFILEKNADFYEPNYNGVTPLQIAADQCDLELLKFFFNECNAKIDKINNSSLINAVKEGSFELINYLIYTWKVKSSEVFNLSLFSIAAKRGDIDIFKLIIESFSDKFDQNQANRALFIASEFSNYDIIKYLIGEKNADPNEISPNSLFVAAKNGAAETLKYIIEMCPESKAVQNVNNKDYFKRSLLIIATENCPVSGDKVDDYMSIIEYLIEEKNALKYEWYNADGKTLLHIATEMNNLQLVKFLVENCHMDVRNKDNFDETPYTIAKKKGDIDMIAYLKEKYESDGDPNDNLIKLRYAAEEGDFKQFKKYLNNDIMLNLDPSLLTIAVEKENFDIIKYLIEEFDYDVETVDSFGRTPLFISAEKGNLDITKYLIEKCGADYEVECVARKTPLHIAAERGFPDIVKYLIERCSADGIRRDKYYQTPLSLTIDSYRPNYGIIKYLDEKCPESKSICDFDERNIIHIAAESNDINLMEYIRDNYNNNIKDGKLFSERIEDVDYLDKTPIVHAFEKGGIEQINYLMNKCGANVENITKNELVNVVDNNKYELVEYLYDQTKGNQDIEVKDKHGQTSLHVAIQRGNLQIVKYLVNECHANIEDKDMYGIIPLIMAAKVCNLDILYFLAEKYEEAGIVEKYSQSEEFKESKDIYIQYVSLIIDNCVKNPDSDIETIRGNVMGEIIENNRIEVVKYLYGECHENTEFKDSNGMTALHIAGNIGNTEITKYLVEKCNANVEEKTRNKDSKTVLHIACENNNLYLVKYLYEKARANIREKDSFGRTALHFACENDNVQMAKYLIKECNAEVNETDAERTDALHIAVKNNNTEFVKFLVKNCNSNVKSCDKEQMTALHQACHNGNYEIAHFLIKECGSNVSEKDMHGKTALHFACENGNLMLIEYLIKECGSNVEDKDYSGRDALDIACEYNNFELLKFLIEECKADTKHSGKNQKTSLHVACERGFLELAKYLIENHSMNVNDNDPNGNSALHLACKSGNIELVQYLVNKADVELRNNKKLTPFVIAVKNNELNIAKFLVENCNVNIYSQDEKYRTALHFACKNNNIKMVEFLIEECNAKINVETKTGRTALHIACAKNNTEIVKYLIGECNANIKSTDKSGRTALHIACKIGSLELVKYLVGECGADINAKDNNRFTALHYACKIGSLELVKYLVEECMADVEGETSQRRTAFYLASESNNLELIKYLVEVCHSNTSQLSEKALPKAINNNNVKLVKYLVEVCKASVFKLYFGGKTSLHLATINNNLELIKYFIEECNSNVDLLDNVGRSALSIACENGNIEIINYLMNECHAKFSDKDFDVENAEIKNIFKNIFSLFNACETGDLLEVKRLIEEEKVYTEQKYGGKTPLNVACQFENFNIIEYLVEKCHVSFSSEEVSNKNIKDYLNERKSLHYACQNGDLEEVRRLIEKENYFADQKINGETALHIATEQGFLDIIKYLLEKCGVNIEAKNNKGKTALSIASENCDLEIIKYLVEERHANIKEMYKESLIDAFDEGNYELVKYFLNECHMSANIADGHGTTVLHIACEKGDLETIRYLIEEKNANLENKDSDGKTPLIVACENGNIDAVWDLIVKYNANIKAKDNEDKTILHYASENNEIDLVKYLINECDANIEAKDKFGKTALSIACVKGYLEIVKYLVEKCNAIIDEKCIKKSPNKIKNYFRNHH